MSEQQIRCLDSWRPVELPGELEFQLVVLNGVLHQRCKVCFLAAEVAKFVAQIQSPDTRQTVIEELHTVYVFAHGKLQEDVGQELECRT